VSTWEGRERDGRTLAMPGRSAPARRRDPRGHAAGRNAKVESAMSNQAGFGWIIVILSG
jgi:hypothetical protein